MEVPTYQQVLADMYEENAPVVLVHQNEYEEEVPPEDKLPDELDDQEEFQKFKPRHAPENLSEHMANKEVDHTLFDKHTQLRIVNIDSRFRNYNGTSEKDLALYTQSSSSNYIFRLKEPIKNVISVRLSSIEIPNSFYSFSSTRGNTSFTMTYNGQTKVITIPDGNWDASIYDTSVDVLSLTPSTSLLYQVAFQINTAFNITSVVRQFKLVLNAATGRIYISDFLLPAVSSTLFTIIWRTNNVRSADFGLGYCLGFRQSSYNAVGQISGEAILNTIDTNYLFLTLSNDWKVVEQDTPDRTQLYSFAKIVMDVPKFSINYDDGQNTLTKEYFFKQPANISSFPVRLSDPYDQDIDLNGLDFSFTLEFREVLNFALYETMRS
jgi:hypothetical protein